MSYCTHFSLCQPYKTANLCVITYISSNTVSQGIRVYVDSRFQILYFHESVQLLFSTYNVSASC